MPTLSIDPGLFFSLTPEQRATVEGVIRLATAKTHRAHALVPNTTKGIEAKTLIVDANDMLMDLYSVVKSSADLIKGSDGTLHRADHVIEDGVGHISVARWEPESWAWRLRFSYEVEEGQSIAEAKAKAASIIMRRGD